MIFGKKIYRNLGKFVLIALALIGLREGCVKANSPYDILTSEYIWCEQQPTPESNKKIRLSNLNEVDHDFKRLSNGDRIQFGKLEIVASDSRPQSSHRIPNQNGVPESLIQLECPGYIQFDVLYNGEIVPGGKSIEVNYAWKFFGSGGLFDGAPDFSLQDVLKMTSLDDEEIKRIIAEGDYIESVRQEHRRTKKHEKQGSLEWKKEVAQCRREFGRDSDGYYEHEVEGGENKVSISRDFQLCSEKGAFYPEVYYEVDTIYGNNVRTNKDSRTNRMSDGDKIIPRQRVYVDPEFYMNELNPEIRYDRLGRIIR